MNSLLNFIGLILYRFERKWKCLSNLKLIYFSIKLCCPVEKGSNHKWKVRVSNSITDVDESGDICVYSMVRVESWPKMRFQCGQSSSYISLNAPRILWESTWNGIQTVWIIGLFSSWDFAEDCFVSWCVKELPVVEVESFSFRKSTESLVQLKLSRWDILDSVLWNAEAMLSNFTYYVS